MSKHHQHKNHSAFSPRTLLHRERIPPLAVNEEYAEVFPPSEDASALSQDVFSSSKSAPRRRSVKFHILGISVQVQISRSRHRAPKNTHHDDLPPPYSGPRSESPMDSSIQSQELSDDCRIVELYHENNCYELPVSPHTYLPEVAGDDPVSVNSLKRSSHTSRQTLRGFHGPITTPDPTPSFNTAPYLNIAPEMTHEQASPVSSSQSPFTPNPDAAPDTRRQSSPSFNMSPLTQSEMPLAAMYQDMEGPPAYNTIQQYPTGFESLPPRYATESSFGAVSSVAGMSFDSNPTGSAYMPPHSSFNHMPRYPIPGQSLADVLYASPPYVHRGLDQYESTAWHHQHGHHPPIFANGNVDHQYHHGNAGQKTWQVFVCPPGEQQIDHVQAVNAAREQTVTSVSLACEICDAVFTGRYCKGNKKRHVKTIHDHTQPTLDRQCSICHHFFNRSDAARKHERNTHSSRVARPTKKRML